MYIIRIFNHLIILFVLEDNFVSGLSKHCLCPTNMEPRGLSSFCGHEIIQKRASAKPSTRICEPESVYMCGNGPNMPSLEVPCTRNTTCIPGSEAYKKLRNNTNSNIGNTRLRFCALNEGKTKVFFVFTSNWLAIVFTTVIINTNYILC